MKLKDYKKHIEGLAKMNNPPVSQCISLLRQLYGKLVDKDQRIKELEAENEQLEKWQIKPTEAICLTDLACRYKKMFKND